MSTEGRRIPVPAFAGDDGTPDTSLARALSGLTAGTSSNAAVLVALSGARLLVPVVAKESAMATVTVTGADGRRALPAFTGTQTLAAWRADARPVAVPVRRTPDR